MVKKIIVYSAEWCPFCHKAMDYLKANNIEFEVKDCDTPANAQEAMKKSGQNGIPVIDIDGQIVTGFNVKKIDELLGIMH